MSARCNCVGASRAFALAAAVAVACGGVLLAQTVALKPGRYAITTTVEAPGMNVPPETENECITPAALADMSKVLFAEDVLDDCKLSNHKRSPEKLTFDGACKDVDSTWNMTVEMSFAADTFSAHLKTTYTDGRVVTVKSSGKRTGECVK